MDFKELELTKVVRGWADEYDDVDDRRAFLDDVSMYGIGGTGLYWRCQINELIQEHALDILAIWEEELNYHLGKIEVDGYVLLDRALSWVAMQLEVVHEAS